MPVAMPPVAPLWSAEAIAANVEGHFLAVNAKASITGATLRVHLRQEGIQNSMLVDIPFANRGLGVAGGDVAAAAMPDPWLTLSTMTLFRAEIYRNYPQAVMALLRASLQAGRWIHQNPEKARTLLVKWLGPSQDVVQQMQLPRWAAVHALNCAKTAHTLAALNQQNTCERRTHHANQDQQNNDGPHHS
jgi:ABC-type nitrate/sulfonate/bicarbonate transport system substrate-binding protein